MKITDIKAQVKRNDRYSIYGDGKYVFSLSENELLNSGIKINQEYDGEELEKLHLTVVLDKAYDRSLNMISRRPRSIWEMRQYLKQKDYDDNVIDEILNKLSNRKYLDDEKFAEAWVRDRRALKKTSKRRLQQELRAKRVSDTVIQKVLAEDEAD
ncbi:MAG: RecX family transcriptional regulator [Patescibacteria group bacterium]